MPARVILQDFTGVPCVVDLAAMRDAMARMGGDPKRINPLQPVDLVIDHSVQVDRFGTPQAFQQNVDIEYQRNRERYAFLRWGQRALSDFRVVPPGTGIVHQVNLEYLAPVVVSRGANGQAMVFPDTVLGTDSHTTMINGLGVVGWGVGGIEAEAAMLGQATVDAGAAGDRLPPARHAGRRRHRHRRRAHRDRDAAQEGRGRQVRRVLRAGAGQPLAGRPRHHREHGARVRRDHRLLPGRRRDPGVPAAQRPRRAAGGAGRGVCQGAGPVPHRRHAGARVQRYARPRPRRGRTQPGRPEAAAGPCAAAHREGVVAGVAGRLSEGQARRPRRERARWRWTDSGAS